MKQNRKGQAMVFGLMMALFAILYALIIIPAFKDVMTETRDASHLDCDNTTISTGTRMTCLIVDLYLPYFVMAVLMTGVGYIFVRQYVAE